MHYVIVQYPDKAGDPYRIIDIRVLELDTDNKPTEADLTLELPAGTAIHLPSDQEYWKTFRLRQDEKVTPNDIPKLQEMLDKADARKSEQRMDTAIPRSTPWTTWLYIGGGSVLLMTASFLTYRRYRSRNVTAV